MNVYWIEQGKTPRPLSDIAQRPEGQEGCLWLDFERAEPAQWIEAMHEATGIRPDERHVRDAQNLHHPCFFDATGDYEVVIFASVGPDSQPEALSFRPNVFFLTDQALITIHAPDSSSFARMKEWLGTGPWRLPARADAVMYVAANLMVDRFLALREPLARRLEEWELDLLGNSGAETDWSILLDYKAQLRRLSHMAEEQQDTMELWREQTRFEPSDKIAVRFSDLLEHIRRISAFTRHLQGDLESMIQLHFSAVSQRTNEVMRGLTVVSVIFLPLNLIAGIFGMNFARIPGAEQGQGFLWALLGMGGVLGVSLLVLRYKRWI